MHIKPDSACVAVGAEVEAGQVICESGAVGFAPEPHVHVEVHDANDPMGPSVPFMLRVSESQDLVVPVAGRMYNDNGMVRM